MIRNQNNHFDPEPYPRKISERFCSSFVKHVVRLALSKLDLPERTLASSGLQPQGEVFMAGQVVLYFEDQADALRFALAAGSVMAGDSVKFSNDLVQGTTRVTRIRLDAVNPESAKKSGTGRVA